MLIKKTDLKTAAGVKLTLVEEVTPLGAVTSTHYRLTTLRTNQPRVLAQRDAAVDPVVQRIVSRH